MAESCRHGDDGVADPHQDQHLQHDDVRLDRRGGDGAGRRQVGEQRPHDDAEDARAIESQNGTYGLISNIGVPSTSSIPPITTTPRSASTLSTVPTDSPTGIGLCGVLVASAPTRFPSNRGTATFPFAAPPVFVPAKFVFAWNT